MVLPSTCYYCGWTGEGVFQKHIFSNGAPNIVYICAQCGKHMDIARIYYPKKIWG